MANNINDICKKYNIIPALSISSPDKFNENNSVVNSTFLSLQLKETQRKLQNATQQQGTKPPTSTTTTNKNTKCITTTSQQQIDNGDEKDISSSINNRTETTTTVTTRTTSLLESRIDCLSHVYDFTRIEDNYHQRSQRTTIVHDNTTKNNNDENDVIIDDDDLNVTQSLADCLIRLHSIGGPLLHDDDDTAMLRQVTTRRFWTCYHDPLCDKTWDVISGMLKRPWRMRAAARRRPRQQSSSSSSSSCYYPSEEACEILLQYHAADEFRKGIKCLWKLQYMIDGIPPPAAPADVGVVVLLAADDDDQRTDHHAVTTTTTTMKKTTYNNNNLRRDWVLDELCRPVVHRVTYHFVTNDDNDICEQPIMPRTTNQKTKSQTNDDMKILMLQTSQRQELALNYLMETAMTGPLHLILSLYSSFQRFFHNHKKTTSSSSFQLRNPSDAGRYYLRDMALLGKHVLRSMKGGSHLLCVETLIRHADLFRIVVERLLRFDGFVERLWQQDVRRQCNGNDRQEVNSTRPPPIVIPRLLHEFVTRHVKLYDRWMMMEEKSAKRLLRQSSSRTTNNDDDFENREQRIFCRECELFVSLLRSLSAKRALIIISSSTTTDDSLSTSLDRISSDVVAPLSTFMFERFHSRASLALKGLDTTTATTTTKRLMAIMLKWCDIITGAHIASHALLSETTDNGESSEIWHRAGRSMERLRDAMIDDAVGVMLEDVLMKRGKMAGYIMTLPHVLFSYEGGSDDDDDDDKEGKPSETLRESFKLLEIMVDACKRERSRIESAAVAMALKISDQTSTTTTDNSKELSSSLWEMGTFGPRVIITQLSQALSTKLTKIVQACILDHNIHRPNEAMSVDGARRLHHDVLLLSNLFGATTNDNDNDNDHFGRLIKISRLASWKGPHFTSLKNALLLSFT